MIRWFCKHKWKIVDSVKISTFENEGSKTPHSHRLTYVMLCEKCGKIKKKSIKY
jgi:hypothetical protein